MSNFYFTDEPDLLGRIEITHAPFVKINHAARIKRSNIVDLDNGFPFAALNKRVGGLVVSAIADACPFRKSYPDVLVMQPSQDRNDDNGTRSLNCSVQGRIFL